MAANVAAIRAALQRIGFNQEASTFITTDQGLNNLEEFKILTDDEVDNLCRVTCKPGGTIPNPTAGGAPLPNPGIPVSMKACNNLKLMRYLIRFRGRTSQLITAADITVDSIRSLIGYRQWEEEHEDAPAPELKFKDWSWTIETIEDYLRGTLGRTKIPLAYVIRDEPKVPPSIDDPPENYSTLQAEMIARAPHHNEDNLLIYYQEYKDDNATVFDKIAELTRNKDCWTYVQKASRTRDGRKAFFSLKDHYLGQNNVDNMARLAEKKLQDTTYSGEQGRWDFEQYVRVQVDQHAILEGLKQYGYSGIDARSKVRYLIDGIKTKDYDTVKAMIMASADLRKDFDACVNLFQDFIKQNTPNRTSNISAVNVTKNYKSGDNGSLEDTQPDMTVEDWYYTRKEYNKLTMAQRKGLDLKRKKRGHQKGSKDSTVKRPPGNGKRLSNQEVAALKRMLAKDDKKGDDVSDDFSDETRETTNRNNKALKRKKI